MNKEIIEKFKARELFFQIMCEDDLLYFEKSTGFKVAGIMVSFRREIKSGISLENGDFCIGYSRGNGNITWCTKDWYSRHFSAKIVKIERFEYSEFTTKNSQYFKVIGEDILKDGVIVGNISDYNGDKHKNIVGLDIVDGNKINL